MTSTISADKDAIINNIKKDLFNLQNYHNSVTESMDRTIRKLQAEVTALNAQCDARDLRIDVLENELTWDVKRAVSPTPSEASTVLFDDSDLTDTEEPADDSKDFYPNLRVPSPVICCLADEIAKLTGNKKRSSSPCHPTRRSTRVKKSTDNGFFVNRK